MTDEIDPTLERAAEAVADRRDDQWPASADAIDVTGAMGSTLERLRQLDRLARAHHEAREAAIRDLPPGMASTVSLMRERGADGSAPSSPATHSTETFAWGPLRVLERLGSGNFGDVSPRVRPRARARGRAQAENARTARRARGAGSTSRHLHACATPTSSPCTAPPSTTGAPACGPSCCAARRSRRGSSATAPSARARRRRSGSELCGALAAVHRAGVVHGDVTAANVMRESGAASTAGAAPGRVVLMDTSAPDASAGSPQASGTPLACAPEVLERRR